MPDILFTAATTYKIRARLTCADNNGLSRAEKGARFFVAAYQSNADGTRIAAAPTVEIEVPYTLDALLADPETAADAAAVFAGLERIGVVMCRRHGAAVMKKLQPPEPAPEPAPAPAPAQP